MPGLANIVVKDSYKSLLRVDNNTSGITGTAQQVYDGEGTSCPLYLGSSSVDIYGLLTVGINGTGYDVKFYGATTDKYMLWDESEDELVVEGNISASDGLNVAGVEVKTTGVLKLKTLTQAAQEALTPAIGDVVMRTDGMSLKTEPFLYGD